MNKLKEEFEKLMVKYREVKYGDLLNCGKKYNNVWNWINQNYISKENILNLECLKEEECPDDKLDNEYVTEWYRGRNQLRNEIKNEIKKL